MDSDMNNENDGIDKWPFRNIFRKKSKQKSPESDSNNMIPTVYGDVNSDDYLMNVSRMGKCLIFNHKKFDKCPERKGTDYDAARLYGLFKKFGFNEIKICNDYKVRQVRDALKEAVCENHKDNSCFVCCILTHGHDGMLCAKDGIYPVNSLYEFFKGSACPTLVGRPKIFFIQACQGDQADDGICVESIDSIIESTDSLLKIPTYADFLMVLSTFPGYVSFKNESMGSYFIQFLCDELEKHAQDKHLMDILTIVNRRVALKFESYNPKNASRHMKKQIPYITSTLTRNVKFTPVAESSLNNEL